MFSFIFYNIERPYGTYGTGFPGSGAIKFGDIALLIGIFAYLLLPGHKYKLGLIGLVSGLVVCLYAGARGGILAAIICAIVWLLMEKQKDSPKKYIIGAINDRPICFFEEPMGIYIFQRTLI